MTHVKMPFQLTLIITRNCNLNCVYCYEHNKDANKMDISIAKRAIEKYLTTGEHEKVEISLFGGEPFMEFELIRELCEWTWSREWKKKYLFFVDTNGTLITDKIRKWTIQNKERIYLGLSLDGTKITHDLNRSNSFDKIDFDFFLANWPEQSVKMTISDRNLKNLANDVIFIQNKGFKLRGCNFAEGVEIHDFDRNLKIIAEQFQQLISFYLNNPNIEVAPLFNMPLFLCENPETTIKKRCGTGDNMAVIDINGEKYPCTYFSPLSLKSNQLNEVKKIDFHDDKLFVNNKCREECYLFPICNGCYGDNFSTTGDISKRSAQKCELIKLRAIATANYKAQEILRKKYQKDISHEDVLTINAINKINKLVHAQMV